MDNAVIEFVNFGFQYKSQQKPTLYDINLQIATGEKVLILGGSGSGKSTLANCINGLIPFSYEGTITGSVRVKGQDTQELSIFELSQNVGTVLQDSDAQFVGLSVGEDIAFAMENIAMPREEMLPLVQEHAATVGMADFIKAVPFDLSGGQKQKVAIAGVLGNDVNIMIFDEPLAALDPRTSKSAVELIDNLNQEGKRTILIIEHRLEDVLHCNLDRIILMDEGRIVADMEPDELLRTDLLEKYGIREPLYITAMKRAGCEFEPGQILDDVSELHLSEKQKDQLRAFFSKIQRKTERTQSSEILSVENVDFAYDKENVLEDVSLTIEKGERISIVGKNGAGKSTLAKLICGVIRPNEGKIHINEEDCSDLSIREIGERIGYVMQNPNQMIIKDNIKDEVELALTLRDLPTSEIQERATAALNACNLYPMRNWPVDAVSYGQKKRITVASILVLMPDVIIMDEPTAGQDYRNYTEIMQFIDVLNKEHGKTIVLITHDMYLALEHTERCVVFSDGQLIADEEVFKIFSDDSVIEQANLIKPSLYSLAAQIGLQAETVVSGFIANERRLRQ